MFSTNTAPIATAQTVTGNEDEIQTITLIGSDVDGDNLTYALASNPLNGTTSLSGNVVTYTLLLISMAMIIFILRSLMGKQHLKLPLFILHYQQ